MGPETKRQLDAVEMTLKLAKEIDLAQQDNVWPEHAMFFDVLPEKLPPGKVRTFFRELKNIGTLTEEESALPDEEVVAIILRRIREGFLKSREAGTLGIPETLMQSYRDLLFDTYMRAKVAQGMFELMMTMRQEETRH